MEDNRSDCALHVSCPSLYKCSPEDVEKLIHLVINKVCGQRGPDFKDFSSSFTASEWATVQRHLADLSRHAIGQGLSEDEIKTLLEPCRLKPDDVKIILEGLQIRSDDIRSALLAQSSTISQAVLKDFDWKVKLILGSDKMANLREPIATVDLDLSTEAGPKMFSLELNKEEIDLMINKLEAANKVVQQLRT